MGVGEDSSGLLSECHLGSIYLGLRDWRNHKVAMCSLSRRGLRGLEMAWGCRFRQVGRGD
jgi:hypothetical protein